MTLASLFLSFLSFCFPFCLPSSTLPHCVRARTEHLTSLVFGHYGKSFLLGRSGDQKNCLGGTAGPVAEKPDHGISVSPLFSSPICLPYTVIFLIRKSGL